MNLPAMRKLQTEILKRLLGPFLFCFLIVMFLLLMQFLILHIERLIGKGLPIGIILELILTNLAYMVVLAVPMSVLVACLMAFGKFSELNEFTAIRAAGINPLSIFRPVMLLATLLAAFLIYFSNDVLPDANYKARSLFLDIRMQRPGFDLQENVFYDGIEGYSFLVRHIPTGSDSLYDVSLFREARNDIPEAVIKAEKGKLGTVPDSDILQLTLSNGNIIRSLSSVHSRNPRYERSVFSEYRVFFDVSDLSFSRSDPERRRRDDRTMGSAMMLSIVDSLQQSTERERLELLRSHGISQAVEVTPVNTLPGAAEDSVSSPATSVELPAPFSFETSAPSAPPDSGDSLTAGEDLSTSPADSSLSEAPPQVSTGLIALDRLDSREQQLAVADRSLISLRNAASGLSSLENTRQWRAERSAQYMVEVHKKIAIPVGCIIFVLVGAPLGILTRKGNLGFNALISAVLFTYYWITIIQGEKLADRMVISPFTGMWFGNATLLLLGLYLTAKVMYEFRFSDLWRSARDTSSHTSGKPGVRA